MKKISVILIVNIILTALILFCSSLTNKSEAAIIHQNSKILVAYFSRNGEQYHVGIIEKGNTAIIAEMIAKLLNADLFEIKPAKDIYPKTYTELTQIAQKEKSKNVRPQISGKVNNFDKYDIVFVGFPIWYGDLPMPVYTFLESYNFSNKTIIPFCTHEGSGIAGIAPWIRAATHAQYVHRGFAINGYIAQGYKDDALAQVKSWIKTLKQ